MIERVFKNHNGQNYCILEGGVGEPALLANLDSKQFVIVSRLNDTDWDNGIYFNNLEDAFSEWKNRSERR